MTGPDTEWQRLDPRMLLVHPAKELVRFLPVLVGVFVAGTATGGPGEWWHFLGVAVPVSLGVMRYVTTSYRIAQGRIELRRGLVNRHVLSTPVDRVRTVDITAPLVHRLLGLTSVRVGTGTASSDDDDQMDLDGLPVEAARRLRAELLLTSPVAGTADETEAAPVVELDPAWVRFAPLTSSGVVIAAGVVGVASQALNTFGGFDRLDPGRVADDAAGWSAWVAVPIALVLLGLVVSVFSITGYVVTNWRFTLRHGGGAWHLRRGLLTTRETTLDDERVRGVSFGEPLGLRLARGARVSAIVTGLDRKQSGSSLLVPPAPRDVVARVAADVLGTGGPLTVPLRSHGARARRRRWIRALVPAAALVAVVLLLVLATDAPAWPAVAAMLTLPLAAALAADRAAALGHALVDGYVVVRSGSLNRRREALAVEGVIGWSFRSTWFQRRAGLTSLVATTAGGRQAVTALDVPEDDAVALALAAQPELVGQFLATGAAG